MTSLPKTMKAIFLDKAEENFVLREEQVALPASSDCRILVKIEYVGLNTIDAKLAQHGFPNWQYPHILGLDAVGTVVQSPIGLSPKVGERVMWHTDMTTQGALSEYTCVANYTLSKVPDTLSSEIAATLPNAGMSAYIALDKLQIQSGEHILIENAASAIGLFAIQFAKQKNAIVCVTANKSHHQTLKKLGADHIFELNNKDLIKKINSAVDHQGLDAVIDISGRHTERNVELLTFSGRIACLNGISDLPSELLFRKSPNINIVSLGGAWLSHSLCVQQKVAFLGNLLLDAVDKGQISAPNIIPVEFSASSITSALHHSLTTDLIDKQVVKIS